MLNPRIAKLCGTDGKQRSGVKRLQSNHRIKYCSVGAMCLLLRPIARMTSPSKSISQNGVV